MKLYRNYDGNKGTFDDAGVSASGPNPDDVSAFAALRSGDGALTVMVVAKDLTGDTPVAVNLASFAAGIQADEWQLTSANKIAHVGAVPIQAGAFSFTSPARSITSSSCPRETSPRLPFRRGRPFLRSLPPPIRRSPSRPPPFPRPSHRAGASP